MIPIPLFFSHQTLQTHQNVMPFVSISGSATFTADVDTESTLLDPHNPHKKRGLSLE